MSYFVKILLICTTRTQNISVLANAKNSDLKIVIHVSLIKNIKLIIFIVAVPGSSNPNSSGKLL